MNRFESIFEGTKIRHKIFCIEASAATHYILPFIKNHVIRILRKHCERGDNIKFNIICYNSEIAKWCVSIAPCTDEYINAAEEWLRHILPQGSCNFLGALVSALRETLPCSFYFIVTQQPNQDLDEILDLFAFIGRNTECHIRLVLMDDMVTKDMAAVQDTYREIASETNGTFAFVSLNEKKNLIIYDCNKNLLNVSESTIAYSMSESYDENEHLDKLKFKRVKNNKEVFNERRGSFYQESEEPVHCTHYKPFDIWKRVVPSQSYLEYMHRIYDTNVANVSNDKISELASSVIVGRQVLARNYHNGHYYFGFVKEQINNELFNIVFGPYDWSQGKYVATDYQHTKLLDLIDFNDAIKRSILPGDRVLAPDPTTGSDNHNVCRYLTGTVLHGAIIRQYTDVESFIKKKINEQDSNTPVTTSENIIVEFSHPLNKTEKLLSDKAIFIPEPLFQRLTLESAMPKSAREKLYRVPNYPLNSLPGYPTSGSKKNPSDFSFTNLKLKKSRALQVDYLMPPYCLPIYPIVEIFEKDEHTGNIMSRSDWSSTDVIKKSVLFKKEDSLVPESKYTTNELDIKVKEQLEMYKDISQSLSTDKNSFYRKMNEKKTERDSNQFIIKADQKRTKEVPKSQDNNSLSKIVNVNKIQDVQKKSNFHKPNSLPSNYSIHEEYFGDLKKIRKNQENFIRDSTKEILDYKELKITNQTDKNIGKQQNLNNINITDLGQQDKARELYESRKLERHRRQVQKRLDEEKYRFCDEEREKDRKLNFYRSKSAERIHKENFVMQREQEAIDKLQSDKRSVLTEVENKVPITKPIEQTFDDIDKKRIDLLKKRCNERNKESEQRNQDALRYIEKIEESRRDRANGRWWETQLRMLKEFPS